MQATNEQTLVLDQSYRPVEIVPWWVAVALHFKNKVEIVEEYDVDVRSTYLVIKCPAVVRLVRRFRRDKKPVKFSRVNIYGRDKFTCQYCGKKFPMKGLTYDHVIPRAQGGKTVWENIVSACNDCNRDKGGRTPSEAKMKLLKKPVQPTDTPTIVIPISRESAPAAWRDYLYWTGELDE